MFDLVQEFAGEKQPGQELQELIEPQSGPQPEVGPEEVESLQEIEPVHRGTCEEDSLIKIQGHRSIVIVVVISGDGLLLHRGDSGEAGPETVRDQ